MDNIDKLFNFLKEAPHIERQVGRHIEGNLFVDTCQVSDSKQPYETAVAHPEYNKGDIVIVEMYDTPEQAYKGHEKWVKKMTKEKLPKHLKDVSTSGIASMGDMFGVNLNETYEREKK